MSAPDLPRRVVARYCRSEHEPDLARLIARLRACHEPSEAPAARLDAIRRRAQLMLRRLADPKFETEEMLAAFAWIVGIADGTAPLP